MGPGVMFAYVSGRKHYSPKVEFLSYWTSQSVSTLFLSMGES